MERKSVQPIPQRNFCPNWLAQNVKPSLRNLPNETYKEIAFGHFKSIAELYLSLIRDATLLTGRLRHIGTLEEAEDENFDREVVSEPCNFLNLFRSNLETGICYLRGSSARCVKLGEPTESTSQNEASTSYKPDLKSEQVDQEIEKEQDSTTSTSQYEASTSHQASYKGEQKDEELEIDQEHHSKWQEMLEPELQSQLKEQIKRAYIANTSYSNNNDKTMSEHVNDFVILLDSRIDELNMSREDLSQIGLQIHGIDLREFKAARLTIRNYENFLFESGEYLLDISKKLKAIERSRRSFLGICGGS